MQCFRAIVGTLLLLPLLAVGAKKADSEGFVSIFDGKTLAGWKCIPEENVQGWRVYGGLLIASTDGKRSYLMYDEDKDLGDFELKFTYRMRLPGNTGVQIRSQPNDSTSHPLKGYHADIGHVGIGPQVLGAWDWHGSPRGDYLVDRGGKVVIDEEGEKNRTEIEGALERRDVKRRKWNDVHIVARGERLTFSINGKIASEVVDNQKTKRLDKGIIALQLHGDKPTRVEFKNIRVKRDSPKKTAKKADPSGKAAK